MSAARPLENARRTTLALGEVITNRRNGHSWRITGFIGKGGMGEVYLGVSDGEAGPVAIKTLPLALADDPKAVLRTQFEASLLRELWHRNVVRVVAAGAREDGVIFMVMEYLRGMTLRDLRRAVGRMPIAWSLEIVRDVAHGLSRIHDCAIHRDLKPANIHFGNDAIVRILDLGAAKWKRSGIKLTSTGMALGTVAYMAPEQLDDSAPVDVQTDLWSLGVILYELVADRHPFAVDGKLPDTAYLMGRRIIEEPHVPLLEVAPLCPSFLVRIVDKALEKDPRRRYGSAEETTKVLCAGMRAFSREHGPSPTLDELAVQLYPDSPHRAALHARGRLLRTVEPSPLQGTDPLDPSKRLGQAVALPYLRTDSIPQSVIDAAIRSAPANAPVRPSDPEAVRVSDVYVKRAALAETAPDAPMPPPPTVRDAAPPSDEPSGSTARATPRTWMSRRMRIAIAVWCVWLIASLAWLAVNAVDIVREGDAPKGAGDTGAAAAPATAAPPAAPSPAAVPPSPPASARPIAPSAATAAPGAGNGHAARPARPAR